jgi:hypothetical protein
MVWCVRWTSVVGDQKQPEPDDYVQRTDGAVVLELTVLPGDPLSGSVRPRGQATARPFQGWIDFMSVLNNLRGPEPE